MENAHKFISHQTLRGVHDGKIAVKDLEKILRTRTKESLEDEEINLVINLFTLIILYRDYEKRF